jgi:hypothetical protein
MESYGALDNFVTSVEKTQLVELSDRIIHCTKLRDDARLWAQAYRDAVSRWDKGVTVANPFTGAGNWYAGNALPTVQGNVTAWTKKAEQYEADRLAAIAEGDALVDRLLEKYGIKQTEAIQNFTTSYATATAEKEGSNSMIMIVIAVIIFIWLKFKR